MLIVDFLLLLCVYFFAGQKLKNLESRTSSAITSMITKGSHCLYSAWAIRVRRENEIESGAKEMKIEYRDAVKIHIIT